MGKAVSDDPSRESYTPGGIPNGDDASNAKFGELRDAGGVAGSPEEGVVTNPKISSTHRSPLDGKAHRKSDNVTEGNLPQHTEPSISSAPVASQPTVDMSDTPDGSLETDVVTRGRKNMVAEAEVFDSRGGAVRNRSETEGEGEGQEAMDLAAVLSTLPRSPRPDDGTGDVSGVSSSALRTAKRAISLDRQDSTATLDGDDMPGLVTPDSTAFLENDSIASGEGWVRDQGSRRYSVDSARIAKGRRDDITPRQDKVRIGTAGSSRVSQSEASTTRKLSDQEEGWAYNTNGRRSPVPVADETRSATEPLEGPSGKDRGSLRAPIVAKIGAASEPGSEVTGDIARSDADSGVSMASNPVTKARHVTNTPGHKDEEKQASSDSPRPPLHRLEPIGVEEVDVEAAGGKRTKTTEMDDGRPVLEKTEAIGVEEAEVEASDAREDDSPALRISSDESESADSSSRVGHAGFRSPDTSGKPDPRDNLVATVRGDGLEDVEALTPAMRATQIAASQASANDVTVKRVDGRAPVGEDGTMNSMPSLVDMFESREDRKGNEVYPSAQGTIGSTFPSHNGPDNWLNPEGRNGSPGVSVSEAAALMGSNVGLGFTSGSSWATTATSTIPDADRFGSSIPASSPPPPAADSHSGTPHEGADSAGLGTGPIDAHGNSPRPGNLAFVSNDPFASTRAGSLEGAQVYVSSRSAATVSAVSAVDGGGRSRESSLSGAHANSAATPLQDGIRKAPVEVDAHTIGKPVVVHGGDENALARKPTADGTPAEVSLNESRPSEGVIAVDDKSFDQIDEARQDAKQSASARQPGDDAQPNPADSIGVKREEGDDGAVGPRREDPRPGGAEIAVEGAHVTSSDVNSVDVAEPRTSLEVAPEHPRPQHDAGCKCCVVS